MKKIKFIALFCTFILSMSGCYSDNTADMTRVQETAVTDSTVTAYKDSETVITEKTSVTTTSETTSATTAISYPPLDNNPENSMASEILKELVSQKGYSFTYNYDTKTVYGYESAQAGILSVSVCHPDDNIKQIMANRDISSNVSSGRLNQFYYNHKEIRYETDDKYWLVNTDMEVKIPVTIAEDQFANQLVDELDEAINSNWKSHLGWALCDTSNLESYYAETVDYNGIETRCEHFTVSDITYSYYIQNGIIIAFDFTTVYGDSYSGKYTDFYYEAEFNNTEWEAYLDCEEVNFKQYRECL